MSTDSDPTDPPPARRRQTVDGLACLAILMVILLAYFRLVVSRYGFGDDFVLLLSDADLERAYLIDGRPLFAAAQYLIHRPIHELGQLSWLRGVSCLATAMVAMFFFLYTKRWGGTTTQRICFSICLGLLPCLHTYVAQANFWLAPCMSVLTLCAFAIIERTVCDEGWGRRKRLGMWAIAQTLMLVASAAYQPTLSWYWVGVLVLILDPKFVICAKFRTQVVTIIGLGLLAFILCFAAFKSYFVLFDSGMKERVALTHDPIFKLYWFMRIQLPLALNYWHLMEVGKRWIPLGIATASALIILSGYVRAMIRSRRCSDRSHQPATTNAWLGRTFLLAFVGLLTHTHWLVIADCPQSYRVIAPLGAAVWMGLYWSVSQWFSTESRGITTSTDPQPPAPRLDAPLWTHIMLAVTIAVFFVTYQQSLRYWIRPHRAAFGYMVNQLQTQLARDTLRVHVVRQNRQQGYVDRVFVESFGSPATERDWMVEAYTSYAIESAGCGNRSLRITHGLESIRLEEHPHTIQVDMRMVAQLPDTGRP